MLTPPNTDTKPLTHTQVVYPPVELLNTAATSQGQQVQSTCCGNPPPPQAAPASPNTKRTP